MAKADETTLACAVALLDASARLVEEVAKHQEDDLVEADFINVVDEIKRAAKRIKQLQK